MDMKLYRQGDILLQKIGNLPTNLKRKNTLVLVYGESTFHSHRLTEGQVFQDDKGLIFLKLSKTTDLIHEEHKTIKLPKGFYAVIRQREYVMKDMTRIVGD